MGIVKNFKLNNVFNSKMPEKTNEATLNSAQKTAIKKLFERTRREVPENGRFDDVIEYFCDPKTEEKYSIAVCHVRMRQNPDERQLELAYILPNSPNELSGIIMHGEKQEVLDFLGNEANFEEINDVLECLKAHARG